MIANRTSFELAFGALAAFLATFCAPSFALGSYGPPRVQALNFAALDVGKPGVPRPSREDRRMIEAVLAATSPADRTRLMFANVAGNLVLYYGDPAYANGELPPGVSTAHFYVNGTAVPVLASYHVIGGGCNQLYNPYDGHVFAGTAECANYKPSRADLAVQRLRRLHANP
jgi:hypothetical protein